jgi:hypothetical protein
MLYPVMAQEQEVSLSVDILDLLGFPVLAAIRMTALCSAFPESSYELGNLMSRRAQIGCLIASSWVALSECREIAVDFGCHILIH